MRRPRIRAFVAAASAALLGLSLLVPTGALGGAATKSTDHFVELSCDGLTGTGGTLFFGATISDVNGASAGLDVFAPGDEPFVDPPAFTADGEAQSSGSAANGAFQIAIPVLDGAGDPAGSATIAATLVVGGEIQPIDDESRDGNHKFRQTGTLLPLAIATGSATLPDGSGFTLDNEHCFADEVHVSFFGTNPSSAVTQFDSNNVNCPLLSHGEQVGNLFVDVDADRTTAFVDAFLFDSGLDATAEVPILNGHVSANLDYIDIDTGAPAGSGAIDMTLAATGERFSYTLRSATLRERNSGEVYDVGGGLTAPGFTFDLSSCVLADRTTKQINTPDRAPKPTGAAPSNDLPSGAKPVRIGTTLTEQTKSAAFAMEAPFDCLTGLDENGVEQPVPVIRTVWFSFTGTGSSVTFDTAGSGFDTVAAAYTKAGGSYVGVPGACVDDVPLQPIGRTLQAAITFPTAAGVTYYVQVGGFPDDLNWGNLHVSVR